MNPLELTYERIGNNGTVKLTARIGGVALACDKMDILRPNQRDDFVKRLCRLRDDLDPDAVIGELVRIAAEISQKPANVQPTDLPEIENAAMIRPELFHTPHVSGVCIPVRSSIGTETQARWVLYLRRADGRRERQDLAPFIAFPDGGRLWIHPIPGEPSPTIQPAWSTAGRRAWLDGSPAPEPCEVFKRICGRIADYIDFAPDTAAGSTATLALWVMFTYVFPAWSAVPYLAIGGPLGSGKSTLFGVLARLIFRPLQSSSMTAPCLFRTLHEQGGTLLLDEAEKLRDGSPEAGEIRSILLSGYKHGSPAMRLEKVGDGFQQVAFDVFGPKAVASIANPPEALASRCIRITMFRAGPDSPKPRRRLDADPTLWQSLRDDLHALALEHGPTWVQLSARANVVPDSLAGRDFELWQPILALASWLEGKGAGGLLGTMQRHAEQQVNEGRDDATPDTDEMLLRIVAEHVMAGSHSTLKAGDILRRVKEMDPAAFDRWSAKGIANALGRYGLRTHKSNGPRTYGRVDLTLLRRIESAYGVDLCLPAVTCPNVPYVPLNGPNGGDCGANGVHKGTSGHMQRGTDDV